MINDYFSISLKNLRRRKVRAWLTLLGIVISVATIFMLISVSIGLQNAVQEQFRLLGTDKLFVMPKGQTGSPGSSSAVQITTDDVNLIEKISGVKKVTYYIAGSGEIEFRGEKRYLPVYGIPEGGLQVYLESSSLKVIDGKELGNGVSGKVLLGYNYKYGKVFNNPIEAGNRISINGVSFKVAGIFSRIGNSQDDKNIIMSEQDFKSLFNSGKRVDYIIVQADQGQDIKELSSRIEKKLRSFRGVTEKTQDFITLTPDQLLNTFGTILTIITGFLAGIAAISLVVGGIGIANTMYTSVLERTKEIGTMKAVGAKNSDILSLFLIESGLIGLTGGTIGIFFGALISKLIEIIAVNALGTNLLKAAFPPFLIIGCLAFAFLTGSLFGILPAYHASKIRPVDALRYE